ncbi:GNAT family N-acetyltransferase [Acidithiobacillus ferrivorans]|uniref:GNAT family N-acetyltransferase n=1 Tax=Acidithiobacillus ferrivorans TaxID=160808 RepID=A0A7T5BGG2_9PROT|nr:GNAT family protein [Acidithiobacillus ferrivorans]QQD71575.1 GNAT family N-acetyltransferase [Acidithiobacillus ferrivorans]
MTHHASAPKRTRPARETPKPRPVKLRTAEAKVSASEVDLISIAGTPGKGKGPGGGKWRIEVNGVRAGEVYINVIDEPPIGRHASLQIYLNIKSQGRGIGRVGYAKACQLSVHETVYAHIRRSNVASRRAAEAAGFVDATPSGFIQLILRWVRPRTDLSI